jgi:hypothetical protein
MANSSRNFDLDEVELAEKVLRFLVRFVLAIVGKMGLKAFLGTFAAFVAMVAVVTYFASPPLFSYIFYQWIIIYWPYVLIIVTVIAFTIIPIVGLVQNRDYSPRGFVLLLLAIAVTWVGFTSVSRISGYYTYTMLADFTDRAELLTTHPEVMRYTPRENAYNEIAQTISVAAEAVHPEDTVPLITSEGFTYAAQITPDDGLIPYNAFMTPNPGFVLYHDDPTHTGTRVERINIEQKYGLRKGWFLDAKWRVYQLDRFSIFEDPHYIEVVNDDGSTEYLTVFPQIKHHYWRLPYWAGVAVVHASGEVELLSVEQATADPRFKNEWIAPIALMRRYVEDQTMQAGFWVNWIGVKFAGRQTIPELPGDNQYPFFTIAADGTPYAYVTTKPIGDGDGLSTMYYLNLATGERTRYHFTNEVVYGVSAALARVTSIGGYAWHTESGNNSSGQMIATEPVYIVRPSEPGKIYWKVTVTNIQYKGVAAQVVFDASDVSNFTIFENSAEGRKTFYDWLQGANVVKSGESLYEQLQFHLAEAAKHQAEAARIAAELEAKE